MVFTCQIRSTVVSLITFTFITNSLSSRTQGKKIIMIMKAAIFKQMYARTFWK